MVKVELSNKKEVILCLNHKTGCASHNKDQIAYQDLFVEVMSQ